MKKLIIFLLLFSFLISPMINADEDDFDSEKPDEKKFNISYMENGWMQTFDDEETKSDCLVSKACVMNYVDKDYKITISKKSNYQSEVSTGNYNTGKMPVRYYEKIWNNITLDYDLKLVYTDHYDLGKINDFVPREFERNDAYVMKVGYGTVTYNGGTNVITVTGGTVASPIDMDDIYDASVLNGWNVVQKYNNTMYVVNATINIGDGSTGTNVTFKLVQLEFPKNQNSIRVYDKSIFTTGHFFDAGCSIFTGAKEANGNYIVRYYSGSISHHYNTLFDTIYTNTGYNIGGISDSLTSFDNCIIRRANNIYGGTDTIFYFNKTSIIHGYYGLRNTNNVYVSNSFFIQNLYSLYFTAAVVNDVDIYDTVFRDDVITNKPSLRFYNYDKILRLIDCISEHSSNLFDIVYYASDTIKKSYIRSNTLNIVSEPNANISFYDSTGLVFQCDTDINGRIVERVVDVYSHNNIGYNWNTPFTLVISKPGYITYNATFNNSLMPMDYQIYLMGPGPWNYSQDLAWKILNLTGTTILKLSEDGNLAIAGKLYEFTNTPPAGNTVAFKIDDNLWLTESGDLYIEKELYRESHFMFYNIVATAIGICILLITWKRKNERQ